MRWRVWRAWSIGRVPFRRAWVRSSRLPDGPVRRAGPSSRVVGSRMRRERVVACRLLSPAQGHVLYQEGDCGCGSVCAGWVIFVLRTILIVSSLKKKKFYPQRKSIEYELSIMIICNNACMTFYILLLCSTIVK